MSDPVSIFAMQLLVSGQTSPETANALALALRGQIAWHPRSPESVKGDANFWEATVGDWQLVLADFAIDDQPGFKPGNRGQSIALTNKKEKLVLMSDGPLFHELAKWLHGRIASSGTGVTSAAYMEGLMARIGASREGLNN